MSNDSVQGAKTKCGSSKPRYPSEQVFDRDICELKCYQEPNCVSYNYGPSGDGKLVCELSNKTHLQVPSDDLQMKDDFIYRQITDVSIPNRVNWYYQLS